MNHPIGELMSTTLEKIREMIDVNTVIGSPITTPDGVTLIPVSKVNLGFASGGSDFSGKNTSDSNFGGGSGAGVKITPVAFLVVQNGHVRVLPITPPATNSVDRIVEAIPDVLERVEEFLDKRKSAGEQENTEF